MGPGVGQVDEGSGAIELEGDDEDSFFGWYIDDDEFTASGDGCYRVSITVDHEDTFAVGGDDTFTTVSSTAYRLERGTSAADYAESAGQVNIPVLLSFAPIQEVSVDSFATLLRAQEQLARLPVHRIVLEALFNLPRQGEVKSSTQSDQGQCQRGTAP